MAAIKVVDEDDDVILIASDGIIIRLRAQDVRLCRRPSKGVRVMRVDEGARIVSLVRAPHEEDSPELAAENNAEADAPAAELEE